MQVILFFDTLCRIYAPAPCVSEADALRAQAEIEAFVRQDNGHLFQPVSIFGISDDGLRTIFHHDSTDGKSLATDLSSGKKIQAAPEADAKQHMLVLAENHLERTVSKLFDFYATRTTVRYEEMPGNSSARKQPLRVVELSKSTVLYHDGDEVVESTDSERNDSSDRRLTTHGTFGPILAEVLRAVETPGRMRWVRWESGQEGRRGVFGFEVSAAESKYFEGGCCLPDADGENSFRIQAGYRGEIAINPESGTIFRLQQKFDMQEYVPLDRDEVVIDYGPVKIGGKTYFCPVRSVSLARGRSIIPLNEWDQRFLSYGPYSTKMNDMRFSNYHVFRAASRLLPGFKPDK